MSLTNDEVDQLEGWIASIAEVRQRLGRGERKFFEDVESRYDEYGSDTRLSKPQWDWLESIHAKYC